MVWLLASREDRNAIYAQRGDDGDRTSHYAPGCRSMRKERAAKGIGIYSGTYNCTYKDEFGTNDELWNHDELCTDDNGITVSVP